MRSEKESEYVCVNERGKANGSESATSFVSDSVPEKQLQLAKESEMLSVSVSETRTVIGLTIVSGLKYKTG